MEKDVDLEKIAVLIDADNSQLSKLKAILDEISTYGRIVVKKAYGDWKNPILKNWEPVLKQLAIKPEQQFAYTKGKNATDIALVIDAMDLLSTQIYDAFAVVCSDADYTPLAIRLRESGVYIFGAGENKTPPSFINACDNFIKTELLVDNDKAAETRLEAAKENGPVVALPLENTAADDLKGIHRLLKIASDKYADDDGWVNVAAAGQYIKRVRPDFEAQAFGFPKLPDLLKAFPKQYDIKKYQGKGKANIVAYKIK
ncbi:MAG TPA: NYN domain-containing protein [Clostridia bacterium]|nr:NYN domain-containing protein [Clostridia bacterium]